MRDSANATSEPPPPSGTAQRSQPGPPARISTASAKKTLACTRKAGPIVGM